MQASVLLLCWGSYRWAGNLWVLIIYLFFLPALLPSVVPRLTTDSAVSVFPGVWKLLFFLRLPSQNGAPSPPLLSFFLSFIFFPTSFWRQWAAFLSAWCPLPAFRSCFVTFTQRSNVLPVKNSNACLMGLLSVSQELIPRKFLSECLAYALNIMRTTSNCISLEGKAFPAFPTSLFEERSLIPTKQSLSLKSTLPKEASVLFSLFQTFLLVIGMVGVMVAAIPWIAIPVIPLGIIFFVLRWFFLRTSRDVKRLECTSEYRGSQIGMTVQAGFHLYHF